MRITIDSPDTLFRRLKAKAAKEHKPARALILRAVELALTPTPAAGGKTLKAPVIPSKRPGTMYLDNARIYDVISFP